MSTAPLLLLVVACADAPAARRPPASGPAAHLRSLERRIAERPDDADALLDAGLLHTRLGDRLRAQQYLARALAAGADPGRALPALVRVSVALRDYAAALRHAHAYEETLAVDCDARAPGACARLAEVRATIGEMHAAIGEGVAARAAFVAALAADSSQEDARRALARLDAGGSP